MKAKTNKREVEQQACRYGNPSGSADLGQGGLFDKLFNLGLNVSDLSVDDSSSGNRCREVDIERKCWDTDSCPVS